MGQPFHNPPIAPDQERWYFCSICHAQGDYDFGAFVTTPEDPPSGLFEMSEDWATYRYACPECQGDEGVVVAAPDEQARLRRLWWDDCAAG